MTKKKFSGEQKTVTLAELRELSAKLTKVESKPILSNFERLQELLKELPGVEVAIASFDCLKGDASFYNARLVGSGQPFQLFTIMGLVNQLINLQQNGDWD